MFKITAVGDLTTLYSFRCARTESCVPLAGLIQASDGSFYGTTSSGGPDGSGAVFQITPAGTHTTLHFFDCGIETASPDVLGGHK